MRVRRPRIRSFGAPETWSPQIVNPTGTTIIDDWSMGRPAVIEHEGPNAGTYIGADGIRRYASTGEVVVFTTDAGSLGDWAKREEANGQIDLRPVSVAVPEPIEPGMFDMVSDAFQGAMADALDPLGLVHGDDPAPDGSGKGAIHQAITGFGTAFGNIAGIAVLAGAVYLMFKFENS